MDNTQVRFIDRKNKDNITLTQDQARNFLLLKQGLIGDYRFQGKPGVCDFTRQAGCVQYDPIDICGRNAELVFQSRVPDFTKDMLNQLLYVDRRLVDYFDKNMSIIYVEDWPYFARFRKMFLQGGRHFDRVNSAADEVKRIIKEKGPVCSQDLHFKERVDWSWSPTTFSRAVLESLYFRGELVIHHKKGTVKYYALAEDFIEGTVLRAADPNMRNEDFTQWQVLRRIGAIGLLWDRPSDAWLGVGGLKKGGRSTIFDSLLKENKLQECTVERIQDKLYFRCEDMPLIETALSTSSFKKRLEFIAPLDNLMWDRKLIQALFNFYYKWEIYTPVVQRKYGYYVLPVLYGNQFAGRIEFAVNKKGKQLQVLNFWKEDGADLDGDFEDCYRERLLAFARFNLCEWINP